MSRALADVVVCEPVRTAVGRRHGALAPLAAADLAAAAISGLVDRTGLSATDVDDVILGQCYPNGEAPAIGRVAALDAGLDIRTPGIQIDRRCGSGLQAVLNAAMQVAVGASEVVIAGGAESMSNSEFYSLGLRGGVRGDRVEFVDREVIGQTRCPGVHLGAAQRLVVGFLAGGHLHQGRAGQEHLRAFLDHHHVVGHAGHICPARGGIAEDQRDRRDPGG